MDRSSPGRRVALTRARGPGDALAVGLVDRGAGVAVLTPEPDAGPAGTVTVTCGFESEVAVARGLRAAGDALGGLDQVVHTWVAPSLVDARRFVELDEQSWAGGCEHTIEAAWWVARVAHPLLLPTAGSLVFVVPTVGMSGGAGFSMLAAASESMRVLAKACGRQWGAAGVTVHTVALAPDHWVAPSHAEALRRSVSLSAPALGGPGDPTTDLAPVIDLLAAPGAHFLTAGTVVADGGTWMGL